MRVGEERPPAAGVGVGLRPERGDEADPGSGTSRATVNEDDQQRGDGAAERPCARRLTLRSARGPGRRLAWRRRSLIGWPAPSAAARRCRRRAASPPGTGSTASALPRPVSKLTNVSLYISFDSTCVPKLPPVMVRTMSKTFSVAIMMVVRTTISVLRIIGIWTRAEQLRTRRRRRAGGLDDLVRDRLDRRRQHHHGEAGLDPDHDHHEQEVVQRDATGASWAGGFQPSLIATCAQQADLRLGRVAGGVDELPDDARADERDRHRHEDQRLRDRSGASSGRPAARRAARSRWRAVGRRSATRTVLIRTLWLSGFGEDPVVVLEADRPSCCRSSASSGRSCGWPGSTRPTSSRTTAGPRQTTMVSGRLQPAGRPAGDEEDERAGRRRTTPTA